MIQKETAFEFAENFNLLSETQFDQPIEFPNRLSKLSLVRTCVKIFAKQLANCVFFLQRSQKIDADVLYIRKKVQPDSVPLDDIEISLKAAGIKFKAVHQNFGWGPSKHGITFVNGIGTFHLFLISQLRIVKLFWSYRIELYQNIHKEKKIVSLYNSLIQIQLLALLKAKILVGTFSDKSYFCLLKKIIGPRQRVISMLDGFISPQLGELRYTAADVVLLKCRNEVDLIDHQKNLIENVKVIGALDLIPTPAGHLSRQIKDIPVESKKVLVALMQIERPLWGEDFHIDFLNNLLDCIVNNKNVQFVIKEKKGELSAIPKDLVKRLTQTPNCIVIRSKSPKFQAENKFCDLLQWTDILISQATNSMTILEAAKHNKKVIAYDLLGNSSLWQNQYSEIISGCDLTKLLEQALNEYPANLTSILREDMRLDAKANFCKAVAEAIKS